VLPSNVLISGRHDPQLVPARVATPTSAAEHAPLAMAAATRLRPTWKQAHTIGPSSAPPTGRPASSDRRRPPSMTGRSKQVFSHSIDGSAGVGAAYSTACRRPSCSTAVRNCCERASSYVRLCPLGSNRSAHALQLEGAVSSAKNVAWPAGMRARAQ
jgi:hypothetical protein